jgi:hypothetical protein
MRRLQDTPEVAGGNNNPFLVENAATAENNPVPIGTEEIGGSNNLAGTSLFRLPNRLPLLFPGQPVPPVNQVVTPFENGGSDGDAFGAFSEVFLLRESSSDVNPFPDGSEATAGNNPVPIGSEEIGGSNNLGETDLFRLPSQLPAIFPGQPSSSANQSAPPFSGGSSGDAFAAFGKVFLKEDPSGGN